MLKRDKTYVGLNADSYGGMTPTGTIIRDAKVFGLIAEEETCEGWPLSRIEALYDKVSEAWHPYGHLVSRLPPELRERHQRVYDAAISHARELGWSADLYDDPDA
jgi:hypothetical protein